MDYLEAEPTSSLGGTLPSSNSSVSSSNGTYPSNISKLNGLGSSVASRLYHGGHRRDSFSSEPELISFGEDVHSEVNTTNQMSMLAQKLNELQEERMSVSEEKSRLRTENAILQERVHLLEDQLQASEQRWKEKWEEERNKGTAITQRYERERQLESERESFKHQVMENEIEGLKKEKYRLSEQLKEAKDRVDLLSEKYTESRQELERSKTERSNLKVEYDRYRREVMTKMENSTEMFEELTRQTDQLRQNGISMMLPRQGSLTDQIIMLEDEIERLQMENQKLCESHADLQAQILHNSVECGRTLVSDGQFSLAAELNGLDSQELFNKLKDQEIINQRLRNYINRVLEKIIELHPSILEIKDEEMGVQPSQNFL